MKMMKNFRNRLFLANHGKRSIYYEPSEDDAADDVEDVPALIDDDEILDEEELSKYFSNSAPTGFFLMPRASLFEKRATHPKLLARPNGFMFPTQGKRAGKIFVRPNGFLFPSKGKRGWQALRRNPNGFNFPIGSKRTNSFQDFMRSLVEKRSLEFDLDADFFGQRGKR